MIQLNSKYLPLIQNNTRYFIITGGRGSAKSFSASLLFTKLCIEEPQRILFTRYTMVAAHLSIIPEFLEKIKLFNADSLFKINKTEIVNERVDSSIIFKGIKTSSGDQTANLKSLQGVTTWVLDEAEELLDESIFDKIDFSIRTKGLQNRVVLIMNPSTKEHWIYKRFFESKGVNEGFNGVKDDTTYIHTTYLDNINHLDESFLKQVEQVRLTHPEKYKHIIMGGWLNKAEGVVFTNWRIGEFDNSIPNVFGQDYGFSIDPSVLVNVAIDKGKRIIYVNECFCKPFMTTTDIEIENKRYAGNKLIIGDNSEGRLIEEIRRKGVNIKETVKIAVSSGIALMQDYEIVVSENSLNIIKELNNYSWSDKKSGTPIDAYNHCFVGETLITTINGLVRIDEIKVGDLVLTSNGYKKVLKTFNNGVKQVNKYLMQLDTNLVYLCSTKEHKIKTTKGWKQISKLKSGQMVYQCKNLTEKNITYIQKNITFLKVLIGFIKLFMNQLMVKCLKVIKFTTKTIILGIIILITWNVLRSINIYQCISKSVLKTILNGLNYFTKTVLNPLKNGINQMKVLNGINNMVSYLGLIENIKYLFAKFAKKNIKQDTLEYQNTAIKTVKLKHLEIGESYLSNVYDIEVEDEHEYFANGVLVHNCIDAIRYSVVYQLDNPNIKRMTPRGFGMKI